MSIIFPENQTELVERSRTDVQGQLPELGPALRLVFIDAIIVAAAGRNFEFYLQLEALTREMFPDTATGTFLERWGSYKNITRNPATQAIGFITASGIAGSNIPIDSSLQSLNGTVYTTDASALVTANDISIVSLTRSGGTVTAVTASDHNLASNIVVSVSGAVETDYNGPQTIAVTDTDTFTYEITTTPTTPATGTILASFSTASVSVTSVDFGQATNAASGTALSFTAAIPGVDSTAYVQFGTIGNGTDIESDDALRLRILDAYQNPIALFNEAAIERQAKTVSGVTRVFVDGADTALDAVPVTSITRDGQVATLTTASAHGLENGMEISILGANEPEYNVVKAVILVVDDFTIVYTVVGTPTTPATGSITATPTVRPGQTIVYFTRDNDSNIIPDGIEVATVKNDLVANIMPSEMSATSGLFVKAPIPVTIPFSFSALDPNTAEMQAAITANLQALFEENTSVSVDLREDQYRSVIFQSVDPVSLIGVNSFTLTTPTGDVAISSGQLPVLGSITYP
jgi:uncharacterized phage protein gp47/JayE